MTDTQKAWLSQNAGLIISVVMGSLFGFSVGGLIWGARLEARVYTIETRGSPQVEALSNRITRVEEKQNIILDVLNSHSQKLDSIAAELRQHELNTSSGKPK